MTSPQNSGLPRGELLGRYRSYEDAQKVVDHLAAADGFDIKALSIVGNDLRTVEHIRTRLSYPRVAGAGAAQGAMFGAFIGLLIVLFSPESGLPDLLLAVLLGMAIWMIVGVISYAIRKGRRDFASSSQLVATTFDVVCDFSVAHRARQLVPGAGVRGVTAYDDPTSQPLAPNQQSPNQQSPNQQPVSQQPSAGVDVASPAAGAPEGTSDPAQQGGASAAQPRAGYDDLPDGRPRFGVRVDQQPVQEQPAQEQPAQDQAAQAQLGDDRPAADGAQEGRPQESDRQ
ncbi:ECF transporter S component [Nesterenkonia sp. CL21]|uniref:general stress protein n=1 Tax=Nesterenkonia sp. CL21 TaxID=3064894 RepID=UPI0028799E1A|nr:general stress protein [Nesterenkonia sp. CL21]MDS2173578.1 ECF transporter S component [Nesterenkonia sp. CL21]